MPTYNLRRLTLFVTIMVVIDAVVQPMILLWAYLLPSDFAIHLAPIATGVDVAASIFKFATMIVFARWIYVAGRNLVEADIADLDFSPASRIWWFFVPIASLFKPFQGMRELWNASRGIWPLDTNDSLVSTWWGLYLLTNFFAYFVSFMSRDHSNLPSLWLSGAADIALAFVAIPMIRGITKGQSELGRGELSEVFA